MSNDVKPITPKNSQKWREWLEKNHAQDETVWVMCSRKNAQQPTLTYEEAVTEALCFGWIDAKAWKVDDEKFMQSFSKRKPRSVWSKINKNKVAQLIKDGRMAQPGLDSIEVAKKNGYWSILDEVEELIIPEDLAAEFRKRPGAKNYFMGLSRSEKKFILTQLVLAKKPETRQKRIGEIKEI